MVRRAARIGMQLASSCSSRRRAALDAFFLCRGRVDNKYKVLEGCPSRGTPCTLIKQNSNSKQSERAASTDHGRIDLRGQVVIYSGGAPSGAPPPGLHLQPACSGSASVGAAPSSGVLLAKTHPWSSVDFLASQTPLSFLSLLSSFLFHLFPLLLSLSDPDVAA